MHAFEGTKFTYHEMSTNVSYVIWGRRTASEDISRASPVRNAFDWICFKNFRSGISDDEAAMIQYRLKAEIKSENAANFKNHKTAKKRID